MSPKRKAAYYFCGGILLFILWLIIFSFSDPARAHDWYPESCCSEKDCRMIEATTVTERHDHYQLSDGRTWKKNATKPSPDGKYHLCENTQKTLLCFFAPIGGV